MIDIDLIRSRPEWVKEQIEKLNDTAPIDDIVAADIRRREILQQVEELRRRRNDASKLIGRQMAALKKAQKELESTGGGNSRARLEQTLAEIAISIRLMQKQKPDKWETKFQY